MSSDAVSDLNRQNSSMSCSSSSAFTAARVIMGFEGTEKTNKNCQCKKERWTDAYMEKVFINTFVAK